VTTLTSDVAIVGGGMIGCWTAFFLRRRGMSVILIEKGAIGAQSSGVNFGNLRLQGRFCPQLPLALRAHALWEETRKLIGDDCGFRTTGHLRLAMADDEVETVTAHAREALNYGLKIEVLGRSAVRRRWPWLADKVLGAGFSPRDAIANPRIASAAVARAAMALGARIIDHVKVTEIERSGDGFQLATDKDVLVESGFLVNAAGAWANDVASAFSETIPLLIGGPPQFVTAPVSSFIEPCLHAVDGTLVLRQTQRGNVLATGFPRGPADAVRNRAPVPPRKILTIMSRLTQLVPDLATAQIIRIWSGIEGYLPDMLPVISPSATAAGLFHAVGFCGNGFQLAPAVGLVLSELIADGTTPTPIGIYDIRRLAAAARDAPARHSYDFDDSMGVQQAGGQAGERA
jgi:sarcosine oxidase, subunit beta